MVALTIFTVLLARRLGRPLPTGARTRTRRLQRRRRESRRWSRPERRLRTAFTDLARPDLDHHQDQPSVPGLRRADGRRAQHRAGARRQHPARRPLRRPPLRPPASGERQGDQRSPMPGVRRRCRYVPAFLVVDERGTVINTMPGGSMAALEHVVTQVANSRKGTAI